MVCNEFRLDEKEHRFKNQDVDNVFVYDLQLSTQSNVMTDFHDQ